MAQNTLTDIIAKVRLLTGRPSEQQITDDDITDYVNNFYVYDLPESMKLEKLKDVYTLELQPNVDTYAFDRNLYFSCDSPVYIGGYPTDFYKDRRAFYNNWPRTSVVESVATGDGGAGPYAGTISATPFLRSVNTGGSTSIYNEDLTTRGAGNTPVALNLSQIPIRQGSITITDGTTVFTDTGTGSFTVSGGTGTINSQTNYLTGSIDITFTTANPGATISATYYIVKAGISEINNVFFSADTATGSTTAIDDGIGGFLAPAAGTIDYSTGVFSITFPAVIPSGNTISAQIYQYQPARPSMVLYDQGQFVFRPVPDMNYLAEVDVLRVPSDLVGGADTPELNNMWEVLAYGAAVKILSDNADYDTLNVITPYFEDKLRKVQRRTIANKSKQRTSTIYSTEFFNNNFYPYV